MYRLSACYSGSGAGSLHAPTTQTSDCDFVPAIVSDLDLTAEQITAGNEYFKNTLFYGTKSKAKSKVSDCQILEHRVGLRSVVTGSNNRQRKQQQTWVLNSSRLQQSTSAGTSAAIAGNPALIEPTQPVVTDQLVAQPVSVTGIDTSVPDTGGTPSQTVAATTCP